MGEGSARTPIANPNFDPTATGSVQSALEHVDAALSTSESTSGHINGLVSLHKVTPLIFSNVLSARTGQNIWLKLDALQPSGSFKIRGVGRVCALAFEKYGSKAHLVTSSGGNAGLAAATACKSLGLKCTVFVPGYTEAYVVALLRDGLQAEVVVGGDAWDACDKAARRLVDKEKANGAVYVHPFVGEDLVDGHASLSQEIYQQMQETSPTTKADLIICTVGGGGMIQGIMRGLSQIAKTDSSFCPPRLVATQDFGADSFSQSMNMFFSDAQTNAEAHVTLPAITSKATSMGAKRCSPDALRDARIYSQSGNASASIQSQQAEPLSKDFPYLSTVIMDDALAGSATWQFHRDHDLLVEISCGAALAPIYFYERLLQPLVAKANLGRKANIVVEVCGGSKIDLKTLEEYKQEYGEMEEKGRALLSGKEA